MSDPADNMVTGRVIVTMDEALSWTTWSKYHINRMAKEAHIRKMGNGFYWEDWKPYFDFRNKFN